jgi:uncharacterized protein
MEASVIEIQNNEAEQRFETTVEGHLALAAYRLWDNVITFTHTEVPEALGGRGIANQLAKYALDHSRQKGYKVVALCPFIAAYINRHAEYQDLLK